MKKFFLVFLILNFFATSEAYEQIWLGSRNCLPIGPKSPGESSPPDPRDYCPAQILEGCKNDYLEKYKPPEWNITVEEIKYFEGGVSYVGRGQCYAEKGIDT